MVAPRRAEITGDINIHEMGVYKEGNVLFVNTRHSCLATVSATHAFKPLWKPKFISRLAPEDRCHLNGLAMENGRARYVTACSTGDVLESWRGGRRDAGVLIDLDSDDIMPTAFRCPIRLGFGTIRSTCSNPGAAISSGSIARLASARI
jgi:uncharacterized protein (TIGR03032 family)